MRLVFQVAPVTEQVPGRAAALQEEWGAARKEFETAAQESGLHPIDAERLGQGIKRLDDIFSELVSNSTGIVADDASSTRLLSVVDAMAFPFPLSAAHPNGFALVLKRLHGYLTTRLPPPLARSFVPLICTAVVNVAPGLFATMPTLIRVSDQLRAAGFATELCPNEGTAETCILQRLRHLSTLCSKGEINLAQTLVAAFLPPRDTIREALRELMGIGATVVVITSLDCASDFYSVGAHADVVVPWKELSRDTRPHHPTEALLVDVPAGPGGVGGGVGSPPHAHAAASAAQAEASAGGGGMERGSSAEGVLTVPGMMGAPPAGAAGVAVRPAAHGEVGPAPQQQQHQQASASSSSLRGGKRAFRAPVDFPRDCELQSMTQTLTVQPDSDGVYGYTCDNEKNVVEVVEGSPAARAGVVPTMLVASVQEMEGQRVLHVILRKVTRVHGVVTVWHKEWSNGKIRLNHRVNLQGVPTPFEHVMVSVPRTPRPDKPDTLRGGGSSLSLQQHVEFTIYIYRKGDEPPTLSARDVSLPTQPGEPFGSAGPAQPRDDRKKARDFTVRK